MLDIKGIKEQIDDILITNVKGLTLTETARQQPKYRLSWNPNAYTPHEEVLTYEEVLDGLEDLGFNSEESKEIKKQLDKLEPRESFGMGESPYGWDIMVKNISGYTAEEYFEDLEEEKFEEEMFFKRLFRYFKADSDFMNVYKDKNPLVTNYEDYERALSSFCKMITIERDNYCLPSAYQDVAWIRVDDKYYNGEEIFEAWKAYCESEVKPHLPKTGEEYLDESVLMEMPASNYTTFEIQPYLIFDDEYGEDENGETDYETVYNPMEEYISRETHNVPSWVFETLGRHEWINLPDLNKAFDTDMVFIIGYHGYYEGISVGIIVREIDEVIHNLWAQYYDEDTDSYYYIYDGSNKSYINNATRYDIDAIHKLTEKVIDEEVQKARRFIIEFHTNNGGKIVPSSFEEKKPESTGDEYNECKLDLDRIHKQINEIVRLSNG